MDIDRHKKTPLFDALKKYAESHPIPFDVPGHKMGNFPSELADAISPKLYQYDVNAPRGLDHLSHAEGVIAEAQALMAEAVGAKETFFLVNGTSVGIMAMIMTICRANEEIILPRNVHKSVISGLILSGATPIFIEPHIDHRLGIANGMPMESIVKAMNEHPNAKAILIIHPTYFGAVSDIKKIIDLAHDRGMKVLTDEAHGAHLSFSTFGPEGAMRLGADMSAISLHKTAGSLTQTSILAINDTISPSRVRTSLTMLQSTSPNYILMASLDIARKHMVLEGQHWIEKTLELCQWARQELNQIPGVFAPGRDYFLRLGQYDFDETKLIIRINELGVSGFEVYRLLYDNYHIQLELAETYVILAVITVSTTRDHLQQLINSLKDLSKMFFGKKEAYEVPKFKYDYPPMFVRPREAYHAPKKVVNLPESVGEISAETIMIYPPGIPMLIAGEIITEDTINVLEFYKEAGSEIFKEADDDTIRVIDKSKWIKWEED